MTDSHYVSPRTGLRYNLTPTPSGKYELSYETPWRARLTIDFLRLEDVPQYVEEMETAPKIEAKPVACPECGNTEPDDMDAEGVYFYCCAENNDN